MSPTRPARARLWRGMRHFLTQCFIVGIRIYQKTISRLLPAQCRFYPTCSNYTIEALSRHGIVTGLYLSFRRICRCHPWNPGGVDLVPKPKEKKSRYEKK